MLADRMELDGGRLLAVASRLLCNRGECVVRDLEGPFDVLFRVFRGEERALARVRDAEQDVVPEAVDEPVPPSTGVRTERIPEVPDFVFRREVNITDRSDVLDPRGDPTVVREVLEPAVELAAEAVDLVVVFRMLREDLETLEARCDTDRMAVIRACMERRVPPAAARLEDVHDLRLAPEARQLEAAARDFAERRHVGPDVVVFLGAAVRKPESCEDLVENEHESFLSC